MKNQKTSSFNSSLSSSPALTFLLLYLVGDIESAIATLYTAIIMAGKGSRKGFGHGGGGVGGTASHAKGLLVVIILVLIIPAVALVFTGPTTGSTGVYGNTTVSNTARQGVVQFSQFIGIAMILGVVGVIVALV